MVEAARYRIHADRIYLTGPSLGGSGTWHVAARYPETFAAIAPISGFTSHVDYIDKNIDKLLDMPVWAFHGKLDPNPENRHRGRASLTRTVVS